MNRRIMAGEFVHAESDQGALGSFQAPPAAKALSLPPSAKAPSLSHRGGGRIDVLTGRVLKPRACKVCGEDFLPLMSAKQVYCGWMCRVARRQERRLRARHCQGCAGRSAEAAWFVNGVVVDAVCNPGGYLACDSCLDLWRRYGRAGSATRIDTILERIEA